MTKVSLEAPACIEIESNFQRGPEYSLNSRPLLTGKKGRRRRAPAHEQKKVGMQSGVVRNARIFPHLCLPHLLRKNLPPPTTLSPPLSLSLEETELTRFAFTVCLHFHPRFQRPRRLEVICTAEFATVAAVNVNVSPPLPRSNMYAWKSG